MEGQESLFNVGSPCGKTSLAPHPAIRAATSKRSSPSSSVFRSQTLPMCLCLKKENGQTQDAYTLKWENGPLLGEFSTVNTGEKPSETNIQEMCLQWGPHSVAEESRLSQTLEACPHPKYYLSKKAILGIIKRSEKRKKALPPRLDTAMRVQAGILPADSIQPLENVLTYDARGNGDGRTVCTITGDHENRITDYTALCIGNGQPNQISMEEIANTL